MVLIELALFSLIFTVILCCRCYIYEKYLNYSDQKKKGFNKEQQQQQQTLNDKAAKRSIIRRRRVSYCYLDSKIEIHELKECLLTYKFPTNCQQQITSIVSC